MQSPELNCDVGEGFGLYRMGDDAAIMPFLDAANIACGFHASDPVTMGRTVRLAKEHGVRIGAHPSLPDREGFGRREMKLSREEIRDAFTYQIGALSGFVHAEGATLNHVKPHGVIYGMAARDPEVCHGICDALEIFELPLYGMAGTLHENIARERGVSFVGEFFADLEYDGTGRLIITREHPPVDPDYAATRLLRTIREGVVAATDGTLLKVSFKTICMHSDTPNAPDIARALRTALSEIRSSGRAAAAG